MMQQDTAVAQYNHLPLQAASEEIWDSKYRLRDNHGQPVDADLAATYDRVAKSLANAEAPELQEEYYKKFLEALYMGATPAGRIMSNAGATEHKKAVSLINCTVSDTIRDDMEDIGQKLKESAMTLKAGCGIGYEFSTLRPKGAFVSGAGADTSGPLPFMDVYDKFCGTIRSAGDRRGAQMGTFDVSHPDVIDFIKAKREDGRLRNFNLSLLITDEFIEAVKADAMWVFKWKGEPFIKKDGTTAQMPAKELWNLIMTSTYEFAEPGFLLIDHINQYNNLWFCEHLRATNPCGEQPLPPYGSCLLGSINVTKFVVNPFTPDAYFDFDKFYEVCRLFARMLDNVVEINGLPLPQQRHEIEHKRRHGMGYLGIGSAMVMLGMRYGTAEAVAFTDEVSKKMAFANFEEGAMLAKEKGEAPVLQAIYSDKDIADHLKYNSNYQRIVDEKLAVAQVISYEKITFTGRELFLMSHYFDAWRVDPEGQRILALLEKYGSRFSHATSIAPTGTISFSFGNNASNGIEPTFMHQYARNVIVAGRNTKETVQVYSYEFLLWRALKDPQARPIVITAGEIKSMKEDLINVPEECIGEFILEYCLDNHILPPEFADTTSLTPAEHIDIQAAAQKWIDSSISKTINVPSSFQFDEFKDVYMYAYEKGLKGCTTYRPNPSKVAAVLISNEDLAKTMYEFMTADGVVTVSGDTMIEYEGQQHTAANLHDAIRDGLYGSFA